MVSVSEALSIISNISISPISKNLPLQHAKGLILSSDILSPINMPPFRQSAMDGYAINIHDSLNYEVIGEIKAGDTHDILLNPGQAVRIFTGARVPNKANCVVIQERVTRTENTILLQEQGYINQNIRPVGEQIIKNNIALKKGTKLSPPALGFLAGLGISTVSVYSPPKVGILITGNELVEPGTDLKDGKIFESNFIQLEASLQLLNVKKITKYVVADVYEETKKIISNTIHENDLVLISGGISVGDYDFVKRALSELEVKELFYKVKQKPGKPLFFGQHKDTVIFALPGNPASSLTCFYIYVVPIIHRLIGNLKVGLPRTPKTIESSYIKKSDRAEFLKAKILGNSVEILDGQNSSMLSSFAISNALVFIPENNNFIKKGESVETIIIP